MGKTLIQGRASDWYSSELETFADETTEKDLVLQNNHASSSYRPRSSYIAYRYPYSIGWNF